MQPKFRRFNRATTVSICVATHLSQQLAMRSKTPGTSIRYGLDILYGLDPGNREYKARLDPLKDPLKS